MAGTPEYGSADFFNAIIEGSIQRLMPMVKAMADRQVSRGFAPGTKPPTLATLKQMPPTDAVTMATAMMRPVGVNPETGNPILPPTFREGARLLRRYLDWIEGVQAEEEMSYAEPA